MTAPKILVPKPAAPKFDFVRASELPKAESITLLAYGGSGAGKTFFCGTAGSRTLIVDCGAGHTTLQSPRFKKLHPDCDPIIVDIAKYVKPSGLSNMTEGFDLICDVIEQALDHQGENFDTLAIDDMTAVRRYAMAKAVTLNKEMGGKSQTAVHAEKHGVILPTVADFGSEMAIIEQFLSHYITLAKSYKKHLIVTAHERLTYSKPSKIGDPPSLTNTRPGFTGQTFPDDVTGLFDEVWKFEVIGTGSGEMYRANFVGGEQLTAKSRNAGIFDSLVDRSNTSVIQNPDFSKLIKLIKGA